MQLSGLDELMDTCRRLGLRLRVEPPARNPLAAGATVAGLLLDPLLATLYARHAQASFATEAAGLVLLRVSDTVNELESLNAPLPENRFRQLALPVLVFGSEAGLAYYCATVPGLADGQGLQPVVCVDTYEEPYALPVASDVDRFFHLWAGYLRALISHPDYATAGSAALTFPWGVPQLFSTDERLTQGMRAGRFDALLPRHDAATTRWLAQVLGDTPAV